MVLYPEKMLPNLKLFTLYNISFCIKLAFAFCPQKDFHSIHVYAGGFCFFLLQKDFEAFLCFFDNIQLTFFYIGEKF